MSKKIVMAAMAAAVMLGGCASHSTAPISQYPSTPVYSSSYGVVDSIQIAQTSSGGGTGLGTVAGGVVGGVLGNQVGSGRGRTAATVAGAVGGAMVGSRMQGNAQPQVQVYQVGVRLDNGSYQTLQQEAIGDLRVGSRVRIENGRVYAY
ncbi:MAG: putative outer rane lipoprotein precursor SlyB-like [Paucimonas sp.]|nr:putative outer rane lipoprotein precursor SlyB-like [Paucimonas sp.]